MANKQKILIVDDDENIAELISLYMTKECFETQIVYDGESALQAADTFAPDLILLDLMLPGISGEELLPQIQNIPVIVVSAKTCVDDKVGLLLGGAVDYLIKPFDTKELLEELIMFNYVWPLGLVVLSNVLYQICAKSVPEGMNPLASLTITYLIGAGNIIRNQIIKSIPIPIVMLEHIWKNNELDFVILYIHPINSTPKAKKKDVSLIYIDPQKRSYYGKKIVLCDWFDFQYKFGNRDVIKLNKVN